MTVEIQFLIKIISNMYFYHVLTKLNSTLRFKWHYIKDKKSKSISQNTTSLFEKLVS